MRANQEQDIKFEALGNIKSARIKPYAVGLVLVVLSLGSISAVSQNLFIVKLLLILSFIVCAFMIFVEINRANKQLSKSTQEFSLANNFTYIQKENSRDVYPGSVLKKHSLLKFKEIITGTRFGLKFKTYIYVYIVGSGRRSRTVDLQVFEITLPRVLPHMVIDSLVESGNGQGSTLPIYFDKSQKIELEGDFNKYFAVYAPDKYGISALSVIAPDVMDVLLRHAALCDIEIIDNKLYFYWPDPAQSKTQFETYFNTVDEVMYEIGQKLVSSNIFANASQKQVHSQPSGQGVHLKPSMLKISIGTVIVLLIYILNISSDFAPKEWSQFIIGIFLILVLIVAILPILQQNKKERLRRELAIRNRTDRV
mgnify:CR=1 FL=1